MFELALHLARNPYTGYQLAGLPTDKRTKDDDMIKGEHRVTLEDAIPMIRRFKGEVVVFTELYRGHEGTWIRVVKSDLITQLKYSAQSELMETGRNSTRITLDVKEYWQGQRMLLKGYC